MRGRAARAGVDAEPGEHLVDRDGRGEAQPRDRAAVGGEVSVELHRLGPLRAYVGHQRSRRLGEEGDHRAGAAEQRHRLDVTAQGGAVGDGHDDAGPARVLRGRVGGLARRRASPRRRARADVVEQPARETAGSTSRRVGRAARSSNRGSDTRASSRSSALPSRRAPFSPGSGRRQPTAPPGGTAVPDRRRTDLGSLPGPTCRPRGVGDHRVGMKGRLRGKRGQQTRCL